MWFITKTKKGFLLILQIYQTCLQSIVFEQNGREYYYYEASLPECQYFKTK